jgi:hypothetical protein
MKPRDILTVPSILICLVSFFLLLGCPQPQDGPNVEGEGVVLNVVSSWFGTFTWSGGGGTILSWTLYDNGTFGGKWTADDDAFSITFAGSYILNDTAIYFEMAGTATSGGANSQYTGSGEGTISEDTGAGTYSIDFAHESFPDQYDYTWEISSLDGESGIYTIETFSNGGTPDPDTYLYLLDSDEIELANDDDGAGYPYSKIAYALISGNTYYIFVDDYWESPGYYSLLVSKEGGGASSAIPETDAGEPDGDAANATTLLLNTVYSRYLAMGDQDWFIVTIP